jgi:hypothetical protein
MFIKIGLKYLNTDNITYIKTTESEKNLTAVNFVGKNQIVYLTHEETAELLDALCKK